MQTIFLTLVVLVTGLLISGRLFLANGLVDKSDQLVKLEKNISVLEEQNQNLSTEIRDSSSLDSINSKAMAMGFTKLDKYSYLPETVDVAFNLRP